MNTHGSIKACAHTLTTYFYLCHNLDGCTILAGLLVQVNQIMSARYKRLLVHGMGTGRWDARCNDDSQQQSYVLHFTIRSETSTAAGAY